MLDHNVHECTTTGYKITSCLLPRDAMHKRGLCRQAVSVCPPVTCHVREFCQNHNKHIFNFFSPSDSETILVSPYQTSRQYSDGDTPKGALNAGAWDRNKSRLWTNSWLSIDHCWTCEQLRRTTVQFIAQTAPRTSQSLFITAWTNTPREKNGTEFNCTQR